MSPTTLVPESTDSQNRSLTSDYQAILAEISRIYEDAQESTLIAINKIRNRAYWLIGQRIIEVEQSGKIRAQYGVHLLENLARDLSFKYSKGFSVSNLQTMRKFYLTHRIQQPAVELSWSHYQLLLKVKNDEKRQFYEKKALEEGWSKRELSQVLSRDKVEIEEEVEPEIPVAEEIPGIYVKSTLALKRGVLHTYRLRNLPTGPKAATTLVVDCGFQFAREIPLKSLVGAKDGQMIASEKGKKRYRLKAVDLDPAVLYTYKAFSLRVVDGDTLLVNIDCGFRTWGVQRLRFRGIDCPPIASPEGELAKDFVEKALAQVKFIVIKTYKSDKYDRYLADIFYLAGEKDPQVVAEQGHFLNQQLLDENLAVKSH